MPTIVYVHNFKYPQFVMATISDASFVSIITTTTDVSAGTSITIYYNHCYVGLTK